MTPNAPLLVVIYHALHMSVLTTINLNTYFEMSSFICSKAKIRSPKFKYGSCDTDHAYLGVVCHPKANTFLCLCTKFEDDKRKRVTWGHSGH